MQQKSNPSFQAMVAANRRAGRLEPKTEKSCTPEMVLVGMRMTPEGCRQADELAREDGRSRAQFALRMYQRGLASYLAERAKTADDAAATH